MTARSKSAPTDEQIEAGVARPAPSTARETLDAAIEVFKDHMPVLAWAGGYPSHEECSKCGEDECTASAELDALAAPCLVEFEYAVQFKDAGDDWTPPIWTNLATAERIEREKYPAELESVLIRRRKDGEPEIVSTWPA